MWRHPGQRQQLGCVLVWWGELWLNVVLVLVLDSVGVQKHLTRS